MSAEAPKSATDLKLILGGKFLDNGELLNGEPVLGVPEGAAGCVDDAPTLNRGHGDHAQISGRAWARSRMTPLSQCTSLCARQLPGSSRVSARRRAHAFQEPFVACGQRPQVLLTPRCTCPPCSNLKGEGAAAGVCLLHTVTRVQRPVLEACSASAHGSMGQRSAAHMPAGQTRSTPALLLWAATRSMLWLILGARG